MSADLRLREFEGNMQHALRSWHHGGGTERREPGIAEMPFEEMLRSEPRDRVALAKIEELYAHWQELVCKADELDQDPKATDFQRTAARRAAEQFRRSHEDDFAWLADLESADVVDEYDWLQRMVGVKLVFRWILAEGFHPLKLMKRLYAVGRALGIEPFSQLTMKEQGQMFSETKAAVSWRMKLLSGLIRLRSMAGKRLPGQKSPHSAASYSTAQQGNKNRAGHAERQATFTRQLAVPKTPNPKPQQRSFLRSLHVPKTHSTP